MRRRRPHTKPIRRTRPRRHPAPAKAAGGSHDRPEHLPTEADVKLPPVDEPAVAAILATKPATPAEWARTAKILADLERPDLAKTFLQKVLDAKLDDKQLAALADEFGSSMFTGMSARRRPWPRRPRNWPRPCWRPLPANCKTRTTWPN